MLDAAKEGLKGAVKAGEHVLQYLRMDIPIFGPDRFDGGELGALPGKGDAHATFAPGFLAFCEARVVEFTAAAHDKRHCPLLFRSRLEFVFVGLAYPVDRLLGHREPFCLMGTKSAEREGHSSPGSSRGAFWPILCNR